MCWFWNWRKLENRLYFSHTWNIKTPWKDDLLCFKVDIIHFIRHINFFNQPVWSRYNKISYYKLLIISQETVCNTRVLSVFTNCRKLKRLDGVSSFQTFPRTGKNHLPLLYRNIWHKAVVQLSAMCFSCKPFSCGKRKLARPVRNNWRYNKNTTV